MAIANTRTTKMQIPVSKKVAEEVSYFAEKWERTQSVMAGIILDVAVNEEEHIGYKIVKRIFQPVSRMARPSNRGIATKDISEIVRLQVVVDCELEEKLTAMGEQIKLSSVKMASVLIDCTLEDSSWCIELVGTHLKRIITRSGKDAIRDFKKIRKAA